MVIILKLINIKLPALSKIMFRFYSRGYRTSTQKHYFSSRITGLCEAFRGLTQREPCLKLEYNECNADIHIAQYESGYHVPKNNTVMEMAKILNVNYIHFIGVTPGYTEDIMLTLLWLDEDDRNTIHLFQLVRNPGKCNASDDKSVRYYDNDNLPAMPQ